MPQSEGATLRALLRRRDLHLSAVTTEAELEPGALDRTIRWVHSSDLADPTPFLSEGLALLTTGTQFTGSGAVDVAEYVGRLKERGVLALGFGTEVVRDGTPPQLVAACRAVRMPLVEVPYRTPFIAVARANAEATAAQAYARRSWALAAQRAIALAALRPDGLSATIAELARQLGTWVGLYDAAGVQTHEHPPGDLGGIAAEVAEEVGAPLRRGARAGSALQVDGRPFTLQTLGRGGHLRGALAIASAELDQEGRGVVTAVVALSGLALEQGEPHARARGQLRAAVVQLLLGDDAAVARRVARELWGSLPAAPVELIATDVSWRDRAAAEWLELQAHEHRGALFFGRADEHVLLVVGPGGLELAAQFCARFDARGGVSEPRGYDGFSTAYAQARAALERGRAGLARFADDAGAGVIAALAHGDAPAVAAATLAPLRAHDRAQGTALEQTLRTWLECDCSHEATAARLGVHRHTVRARLSLCQQVVGRDLDSFAERAQLWAALQLAP